VDSSVRKYCRQRQGVTSRTQHNVQNATTPLMNDIGSSVLTQRSNTLLPQLNPLMLNQPHATLFSLPSELITRISFYLTLPDYSRTSRTCKSLHTHFQKELILFLRHVYGLSVRSGSLILFAYGAHLQYRAPRLLDRIMDEFFVDAGDNLNIGSSNSKTPISLRQANSRWPTYWSVLYSLDKAPPLDPPQNYTPSALSSCCSDHNVDNCNLQSHQNISCYCSEQMVGLNPKLQFLEKYASRMNAKFASRLGRGGERHCSHGRRNEWFLSDVRQKKTYRMLIMQNIKYGDVELLRFYLEKYGAPINGVVRFTPEEQVCLMQDRNLMDLLEKHGIRVLLTE
ncbi:24883_t:CDS:2, partial [Gigaspora rosea]